MGRLDDAAKRKVVELRRAGLSFRKIKAVLELENIKVSAQAIYLFLKEFQGRAKPEEAGGVGGTPGAAGTPGVAGVAGRAAGWADRQMWGTVQEVAPHPPGNAVPVDSPPLRGTPPGGTGNSAGPSGSVAGSRAERNEEDIRIVSVTSLARGTQHGGPHAGGAGSNMGPGVNMRRKVPLSPASNPILVARKKLLDKALLHKARMRETIPQSGQQVASLLRRDPSCPLSPDVRKVTLLPQTPGFGLSPPRLPLARRGLLGQPVATVPRRPFQQKPGASVRSLPLTLQREPPPHPGMRAAHTAASPPVGQVTCTGSVRSQPPAGQPPPRKDTSPAPLKVPQEPGVTGSLQEQLQTLGLELRGLGLAVRALAEQQGRLERENAQQTQVQRQILSTLQDVASRLGPGSLHHVRNASAPPGPASYGQGPFDPVPATYGQSAPLHPEHCALDGPGLDTLEAYKLAGLSPHRMNGFQAGGSSDSLTLAHTPTYTQTQTRMHTPVYTQSQTRIHTSPYTQSQTQVQSPTYTQSHAPTYSQSYTEVHSQTPHYPAPNINKPLQGCSPPTQSCVNSGSPLCLSPSDPELNIIKVETL